MNERNCVRALPDCQLVRPFEGGTELSARGNSRAEGDSKSMSIGEFAKMIAGAGCDDAICGKGCQTPTHLVIAIADHETS